MPKPKQQKPSAWPAIVLILAAAWLWQQNGGGLPFVRPEGVSAAVWNNVQPIRAVVEKASKEDRAKLSDCWTDFASQLPGPLRTIGAFKATWVQYSNDSAEANGLAGKFPGFSEAADKAFVATFGEKDGPVDGAKMVEFAKALAGVCK